MPLSVAKQRAVLTVPLIAGLAAGLYVLVRQFGESSDVAEAERAIEERRFDDARLHLKKHLDVKPKDASARLLAAQAARRAGKYDEAKLQLRTLETDRISSELLRFEQRLLAIEQGELSGIDEAIATCRDRPNVAGESPPHNRWLGVRLLGRSNRDIVGSTVTLESTSRTLTRFAKGGGSYLSSGDRRLLFGLGESELVRKVTVKWSWGESQSWENLEPGSYWDLREGEPNAVRQAVPR